MWVTCVELKEREKMQMARWTVQLGKSFATHT